MAITIDWPTGVINVPQADLTLITGTLYELDTNQFRLDLKSLEDSEQGIAWPKTHIHNTSVTVAGTTFARTIEILPPYSVQFENGSYSVRLAGSNNNIFDVENGILVQNSVQVISQNSAGLITVASGSGLSAAQNTWLQEIYRLLGLDAGTPPTTTPTSITFGGVTITITGDGETSTTLTRQ